jgi:ElaB/YqjD/DUF883 family membrane-anchored ribosome-binding protein
MNHNEGSGKSDTPENGEITKNQILRRLRAGEFNVSSLERKIKDNQYFNVIVEGVNQTKNKLQKTKNRIENYGSKAEKFIENNPKKAVAMAAAAGLVAGTLWAAFKRKKSAPPKKKSAPKSKTTHPRLSGTSNPSQARRLGKSI